MIRRIFIFLVLSIFILNASNAYLKAQKILQPISRIFWGNSLINYSTPDFLFIGAGGAILISDVVSKDSLKVLNNIYLPSIVQDIHVRSNILYALDLVSGLYIFDITDILNPIQLAKLNFGKRCYDFLVDSNYIYIAHDINGVSKVNITDPTDPFLEYETTTPSKSISKYENFLYCQPNNYNYPDSIRILNSETLSVVGGFQVGLSGIDFEIKNLKFHSNKGFLFEIYFGPIESAGSISDLTILDMTDPINPVRKGQIRFFQEVLAFTNSNDTLFLGNFNELLVVDASDINNPTLISSTPNIFRDNYSLVYLSFSAPYMFGSYDYLGGLQIISMQDIINPEVGLFFDTSSKISSIGATNSVLIAGREEGDGLYFVDISNITNPIVKKRYNQDIGSVRGLKIKGDNVFAASDSGLKIYQINNLDSLQLIGELNYGSSAWQLDLNDSIVAVSSFYNDVHLINISNPTLPEYVIEIDMLTGMHVNDIALKDSLLFISGLYGYTTIFNISDPYNPEQLWEGSLTMGNDKAMFVIDTLLFLGEPFQIHVLNIEDPANPVNITDLVIANQVSDIFVKNNFLFVSCYESISPGYNGFLYVFDIADPHNINQIAAVYTVGLANNIFVNEEYIFLSDFGDGVFVFRIIDFTTSLTSGLDNQSLQNSSLYQNYPNPFNPTTTIKYSIPNSGIVQIKIYDILGNEINTLLNEYIQDGTYEIEFNASGLPSGIYFYEIKSGSYLETKKMILLR